MLKTSPYSVLTVVLVLSLGKIPPVYGISGRVVTDYRIWLPTAHLRYLLTKVWWVVPIWSTPPLLTFVHSLGLLVTRRSIYMLFLSLVQLRQWCSRYGPRLARVLLSFSLTWVWVIVLLS